jgi:hypothetical protein
MKQNQKLKRDLRVQRSYEVDRMSGLNLQVAYEQLLPLRHYRMIFSEQDCLKTAMLIRWVEEVKP